MEIILLVLALAGVYEGIRLSKAVLLYDDPVGPGWSLFTISSLLIACTITLLIRQLIKRRKVAHLFSLSLYRGAAGQAILLLAFYTLGIMFVGYVIASAIFFVFIQRIFGERSWPKGVVIGAFITGCFFFFFSYLAGLLLP